jgi:hypothetical protein
MREIERSRDFHWLHAALVTVLALTVGVAAGAFTYDMFRRGAEEERAARAAAAQTEAAAEERLRSGIERSRATNAAEAVEKTVCAMLSGPCGMAGGVLRQESGVYETTVVAFDVHESVCVRVFVRSGLPADAADWPRSDEGWERC